MTQLEKLKIVKNIVSKAINDDDHRYNCRLGYCPIYDSCRELKIPFNSEIYDRDLYYKDNRCNNCCANRVIAVCKSIGIDMEELSPYDEDEEDYMFETCREISTKLNYAIELHLLGFSKRPRIDLS